MMKSAGVPVDDLSVQRFAAAILSGDDTSRLLPARISDCALTKAQKETIRAARKQRERALKRQRKALRKKLKAQPQTQPKKKKVARRKKRKGPKKIWVTFVQGGAPGLVQQR